MSRTATAKTERMSATATSLPVLVEQKSTNSILNEAMKKRGLDMDTSWFARARRRRDIAEAAKNAGGGREV